jgi:hypothetical protein
MSEKANESIASGLGMRFHQSVVQQLRKLDLRVRTSVSIVHQQKAKRWLLAADEGGGSLKDIAHYVGYIGVAPDGLDFSLPVQALIPNATHRRIAAVQLVRFEILRAGESCDLAVTHHFLQAEQEGRRPQLRRSDLFVGRSGVLTEDSKEPIFFDRSGEEIDVPSALLPGIHAVAQASFCFRCHHAHLIGLPPLEPSQITPISPVAPITNAPTLMMPSDKRETSNGAPGSRKKKALPKKDVDTSVIVLAQSGTGGD